MFKFKKVGSEVILYEAVGLVEVPTYFKLWFADLKQHLVGVDAANFEIDELNTIDIGFRLTKEILGGFFKFTDGLNGGQFHLKII